MDKYIDAEVLKNNIHKCTWVHDMKCVEKFVDMLPAADVAPQWIPVTERLPKEICDSYWVCTDSGYQCECRWTNTNRFWPNLTTDWHWNIFDIPQYTKVVAWMPLPEPYKGGEEE